MGNQERVIVKRLYIGRTTFFGLYFGILFGLIFTILRFFSLWLNFSFLDFSSVSASRLDANLAFALSFRYFVHFFLLSLIIAFLFSVLYNFIVWLRGPLHLDIAEYESAK